MIDRPLNIRQRFLTLALEGGHIAKGGHGQRGVRVVFTENPTLPGKCLTQVELGFFEMMLIQVRHAKPVQYSEGCKMVRS